MSYIENWLKGFHNKNTRMVYRIGFLRFLRFVYEDEQFEKLAERRDRNLMFDEEWKLYEQYAERYLSDIKKSGRNFVQDMRNFTADLQKTFTPNTCRSYAYAIRDFLLANQIELSLVQVKSLAKKMPPSVTVTEEEVLTKALLSDILGLMDARGRAFFLLTSSSGIRADEGINLFPGDIREENGVWIITIRAEISKSKRKRETFCSMEAREAVENWLKMRDNWLEMNLDKNVPLVERGYSKTKDPDDERIFPFDYEQARRVWNNVCDVLGVNQVDQYTKRRKVHIHLTRKFFITTGEKTPGVPLAFVRGTVGHKYYMAEYSKFTMDEKIGFYRQMEPYLSISGIPEFQGVIKDAEKQRKIVREQEILIEQLKTNQKVLELKISNLESSIEMIQKKIEEGIGHIKHIEAKKEG